jgi:dinuclear metal center YbgI/SA1388 family protein
MPTVRHVLQHLEQVAPTRYAFDFDRVGLQVGDLDAPVASALVSLDRSLAAIDAAREDDLLLAHHPLLFRPIDTVTTATYEGRAIHRLIQNQTAFIAAHTNWDSALGGVNDAVAAKLGLTDVEVFGSAAMVEQFKLSADLSPELYQLLCVSLGHAVGFRPSDLGMVVSETLRTDERRKLPPSLFEYVTMPARAEQPAGRIGDSTPMTLRDFALFANRQLVTQSEVWGDPSRVIRRIAVVGGAAGSEWRAALAAGADLFISGEIRQDVALEASESGLAIMASGHYATEQPGVQALAETMQDRMPEISWRVYEPDPGFSGRPLAW